MSKNKKFGISQGQWIVIGSVILIMVGIVILDTVVESRFENRIESFISQGEVEVDCTLLINQFFIKVKDSARINLDSTGTITLRKGRVDLLGLSWWKFITYGKQHFSCIEWSFDAIELKAESLSKSGREENKFQFGSIRGSSDTISLEVGSRWFRSRSLRFEVDHSPEDSGYVIQKVDGLDMQFFDPKSYSFSAGYIIKEDNSSPLLLTEGKLEEQKKNIKNRVLINVDYDSIQLVGEYIKPGSSFPLSFGSVDIHGAVADIRQFAERPLCDGEKPCVQKTMSEILSEVPVRDTVNGSGTLHFRHYEEDQLSNEFHLRGFDMQLAYDSAVTNQPRLCRVKVSTPFNDKIATTLEGQFSENGSFNYRLCTRPFEMSTLNSCIPKQEGYSIRVETGKCNDFCMYVKGTHYQSSAEFDIAYENLDLDITGDKKLKTGIIRTAIPLLVNKEYDSEEEITHEEEFPRGRTFFYQLGQHVNHGFKSAILKSWVD